MRNWCTLCREFVEVLDAGDPAHPQCAQCHRRAIVPRNEVVPLETPAATFRDLDVPPPVWAPPRPVNRQRPSAALLRRLTDADAEQLLADLVSNWSATIRRPEVGAAMFNARRVFTDPFVYTIMAELVVSDGDWCRTLAGLRPEFLKANGERLARLGRFAVNKEPSTCLNHEPDPPPPPVSAVSNAPPSGGA